MEKQASTKATLAIFRYSNFNVQYTDFKDIPDGENLFHQAHKEAFHIRNGEIVSNTALNWNVIPRSEGPETLAEILKYGAVLKIPDRSSFMI